MAKSSPFGVPTVESAGPASRTPDANPYNPQRSSPSIALLTPAKLNFGVKSNPFAAPQAEVPTNAQMYSDPTPQNISRPQYGTSAGPFPGTFPVIAMPPQDRSTQTRKYIFFGLIAASVAVATMLLTWKFMVAPKAQPPQQEVQVQNG